jgi:hypothetical protein
LFNLCVGPGDVTTSAQIRPVRAIPLSRITLTYRLDGLSQELNETFSLEVALDVDNRAFFPNSDVTISCFNGTIIDQDSELRD